ncbi:copper homeostasis protein CutC [Virgibacillus oceani]|uniref:PF03932 family protein CutC n=1 Tax=Virgibacillus oceani TaxID=1479511 RepID=A0A917HAU8_9BACI|nr:copper homeostasis protein CutC [Virgibacillus oceani]GGG72936.1 copper homeostasis protein CutC [Virgibacillus oceani]
MLLEVIVQNGQEAKQAEELGADRIELVSAIQEGGLTPSFGAIKQVLESVSIPVQVMIRPHSYHFCYTNKDMGVIREDIQKVLELGGTGIVFGALHEDNTINETFLEEIIQLSPDLDITFHRAFDEVPSQMDAYRVLAKYKQNVKRILTSGGESNCFEGKEKLRELEQMSQKLDGPTIMPGAGLTSANIGEIHDEVKAVEYHFGKALRIERTFMNGFDEKVVRSVINRLKGE